MNLNPNFDDLINPSTITNHLEQLKQDGKQASENIGLLKVKSAKEWLNEAKNTPIPGMLFSEFWFENEVCILFADTNMGKSILAVQIADNLSRGKSLQGFKNEIEKQQVLYFDFELSAKQFEVRYSEKKEGSRTLENHYPFDNNFKRIEINPEAEIPENGNFENYLNESLENCIIKTGAKILIIDNITYLKNETEKAKNALPLMKYLKALKNKYKLSILCLAHTPKRDLSKPITRNDLQGSKMLINFVDSCFTIGESTQDKTLRYLMQIKARNTEILYHPENVILCEIVKNDNFLQFKFLGYGIEREHLRTFTEKDRDNLIESAKELSSQGKTQREISKMLGISLGAVNKYLKL